MERTRLRLEPHTTGALGPGLLTAGPRPAPGWSCPGASLAGPGLTSGQQLWKAAPPLLGAGRVLCRRCPPPRLHAGLLREIKNGDAQAPTWAFPSSQGTERALGQKRGPENSEACTEGAGPAAAHACGCRTGAEPQASCPPCRGRSPSLQHRPKSATETLTPWPASTWHRQLAKLRTGHSAPDSRASGSHCSPWASSRRLHLSFPHL